MFKIGDFVTLTEQNDGSFYHDWFYENFRKDTFKVLSSDRHETRCINLRTKEVTRRDNQRFILKEKPKKGFAKFASEVLSCSK